MPGIVPSVLTAYLIQSSFYHSILQLKKQKLWEIKEPAQYCAASDWDSNPGS